MKSKTYLEQLDYPTRAIRIYTNCTVENKKKGEKKTLHCNYDVKLTEI